MAVPRQTETRTRSRIRLTVVAVAASLIAGCGSGDDERAASTEPDAAAEAGEAEPLGEETAGSVAQLAQCRDWRRGDRAEKLATIADIRSQVNLQDSGFDAPPLSDDEAMELFDSACSAPYAQGFRLYILYARGAATAPLVREQSLAD
jgi:hypothetical protein